MAKKKHVEENYCVYDNWNQYFLLIDGIEFEGSKSDAELLASRHGDDARICPASERDAIKERWGQ